MYGPRKQVTPRNLSTVEETIIETDESDDKASLFSHDNNDKAMLNQTMKSQQLSDAFTMVFDPQEDIHHFWSTYRFLQHQPQRVLYDTGDNYGN